MKMLIVLVCFLTILFISTTASASNLQGCCSHHDGVVSVDGKLECGDGTSLSNVCESKIEVSKTYNHPLSKEQLASMSQDETWDAIEDLLKEKGYMVKK